MGPNGLSLHILMDICWYTVYIRLAVTLPAALPPLVGLCEVTSPKPDSLGLYMGHMYLEIP